jgi:hypothetical protein
MGCVTVQIQMGFPHAQPTRHNKEKEYQREKEVAFFVVPTEQSQKYSHVNGKENQEKYQ